MEFVQQMEDLAKGLRAIPGYKHIILFSHGFPRSLYEGDSFFQLNYDRMAREFATSNSPVHTINTEGRRQYAKSIDARGDATLKNLSQYSGGGHFHNVRQRESIAEDLQALTGNFYVLGYYVNEVEDGKFRMGGAADRAEAFLLASEPLTTDVTGWVEVPEYTALMVSGCGAKRAITTADIDIW